MKRPNVLLVVIDAARADHTSVHGYDRPTTPHLEELAADGYRFDNAFAAAPWTPPSHGSIFSGVHPTSHGFLDGGMTYEPPHPPLADRFRQEGYRTFGAVQNSIIASRTEITRGFSEYCDLYRLPFLPDSFEEFREYYLDLLPGYFRLTRDMLTAERKPMEHLSCEYIRTRLRRTAKETPFFGFINILSPHSKYAPPEPYRSQFSRNNRFDIDEEVVEKLSHRGGYRFLAGEIEPCESEWTAVKDRYDGEIAFADNIFGTLVDTLRDAGVYDETMILVTADHGEHFGEHGRAYHHFSLFDEVLHVPLIIKPPGDTANGSASSDLVSLIDIYPTILSEVGLSIPDTIEGTDIFETRPRETVFAEYGEPKTAISTLKNQARRPVNSTIIDELDHPLQCARTRNTKYVRVHGAEDRIYKVGKTDPKDTLIGTGQHPELGSRMSETLGSELRVDSFDSADPKVQENLKALGYM